MNKNYALIIVLMLFSLFAQAQKIDILHFNHKNVICYADSCNKHTRIAPPVNFAENFKRGKLEKTAEFIVTYSGFTTEAKTAFQYAVDIWSTLVSSPVPIRLHATWESLDEGVLGHASPATFYRGFAGAKNPNYYYPVALVEKILRRPINSDNEADIEASFSNNMTWYYGTDGKPTIGKFDLVSVVLHEIGHGLGFVGSFYKPESQEIVGFGLGAGSPVIFDHFIENTEGKQLIADGAFENPSAELLKQTTSGKLYFNSPINISTEGTKPKLYAPTKYNSGSSVYHLDETLYYSANPNSLMSPQLGYAEAIHNPGPITLNIFKEIGWVYTYIDHSKQPDIENTTDAHKLAAIITSDSEIIAESLKLYYSYDSFKTAANVIELIAGEKANEYIASLPGKTEEHSISYYFSVKDNTNRTYTLPAPAPQFNYTFFRGKDKIAPIIDHSPISYLLPTTEETAIMVKATDNLGVKSVELEWLLNDVQKTSIALSLKPEETEIFEGKFQFAVGSIKSGDKFKYRVKVTDSANEANISYLPASGYYEYTIEEVFAIADEYENNFDIEKNHFIGDLFKSSQPSGFNSLALHSVHPYKEAGENNEYNFVSQLKVPIRLRNNDSYMAFREVVMVEEGSEYQGVFQLWDYVVIEGSKDGGKTWLPITKKYDSADDPKWHQAYIANAEAANSYPITESLYLNRLINLRGITNSFNWGDEIIIRFRLYSDAFTAAWGWALDNLAIQGKISATGGKVLDVADLRVFPNPSNDKLTVQAQLMSNEPVTLALFNLTGQKVLTSTGIPSENIFNESLDLSTLNAGIYLFKIEQNGKSITQKISKL